MNIGLNVGYSHTKAIADERVALFPSVVGTLDRARFSIERTDGLALLEPREVLVGEEAVLQSRFVNRREDRNWIAGEDWYILALAALTELTTASVEARIVTGLPVAFYDDKQIVIDRLIGEHRVRRDGRNRQTITVTGVRVVPEPYGCLFDQLWDNRGVTRDAEMATAHVGIIDIGGKTTNLLSVHRITEIARQTSSISAGAWDVVRSVREWLHTHLPGLEPRDHALVRAIIAGTIHYRGEAVDLTAVVAGPAAHLAARVVSEASQLWDGAVDIDRILITGGGALLVGKHIAAHPEFPHAHIVDDPILTNARGFWKYARYLAQRS
jgi:plasmid segregation protein ParM